MRNKYEGVCFICGNKVGVGNGFFQSKPHIPYKLKKYIRGKWILRCQKCIGQGNTQLESSPFYQYL